VQRCSDGHMQGAEAEAVGVGEGGVGDGVGVVVGVGLKMCRGADGQMDRCAFTMQICRGGAEVVQRGADVQMYRGGRGGAERWGDPQKLESGFCENEFFLIF